MPDTCPDVTEEALRCPLCEYNLRGLSEPRCPECGYRFKWEVLRDPDRRPHPYLFEHHPERNWWSFWRTLWHSQRPRKFWNELNPVQPSRPARLTCYWLLLYVGSTFLLLACFGPFVAFRAAEELRYSKRQVARETARVMSDPVYAAYIVQQNGSVRAYLDSYPKSVLDVLSRSWFWVELGRVVVLRAGLVLLLWLWPFMTVATLLLFRISMRRARVRSHHILRCVVYSLDILLFTTCLYLPITTEFRTRWYGPGFLDQWAFSLTGDFRFLHAASIVLLAGLLAWCFRLFVSYRDYLRFDRPLATVVASQIVVGLAALILVLIPAWL